MRRKIIILISLFVLCVLSGQSQKMVVRNFRPQSSDLSANTPGTMRKDHNGNVAALIKIRTTIDDLTFGAGNLGITDTEHHPAEWWVWVPERSQKILISNPKYGIIEYFYENEINPAKTYTMELTFEGRDVAIETSVPRSRIIIDGAEAGLSPVNTYLAYGLHPVRARNGSMVYEGNIDVTPDGTARFRLDMEDESLKYGGVVIKTAPDADIFFDGEKVGSGMWDTRLMEGTYVVETRRENADPSTTSFTVTAQRDTTVQAVPPVPHTGYLKLAIQPDFVEVFDGERPVAEPASMTLPVGEHEFRFVRDGFHPTTRRYDIRRNIEINDSVRLKRIEFVKRSTAYASLAFSYISKPGFSFAVGAVYNNIDLSASYTLGFGESDPVYWYESATGVIDQSCTYKANTFAFRLGYQIILGNGKTAVTPLIGYQSRILSSSGNKGDGLMCSNLSIGAKVQWVPVQHVGFFAMPEFAIPVQKNELGDEISSISGLAKGGFQFHIGVTFNI